MNVDVNVGVAGQVRIAPEFSATDVASVWFNASMHILK